MSTTVTGSKRHLNINADEFAGDLNGTVNTATTATTQSTSDNSTKVATTAFVKAQGYATGTIPTFSTVGAAFRDLGDVSVVSYVRVNADETLSYLNAAQFLSAIGGTGNTGTVTSVGTGNIHTLSVSGTTAVTLTPNVGAVTDGGGNLATGDHIYDHVTSRISGYATESYVDTSISSLVDSAPGTLNTLNELADALGDDANFSTTVTNSIATKLPLAGGTMSGAINMGNSNITGVNAIQFADPGPSEGVTWTNTKIYESPNDLTTNTSGNLQLVYNNTRRLTVDSGGIDVNGNIVVSGTVDGVDIATRDSVLTSTTTTANAALPKSGGTMTGDISLDNNDINFTCGSITSDGTTFAFDGAGGKEVLISSARDVRVVIDDNNDDTDNTFEIHKHSFAGGNELLTLNQSGNLVTTGTITGTTLTGTSLDINGNADISGSTTVADITANGHIYGRNVNGEYSNLYRMGGIYFTWDSDSYGTNFDHSITSTSNGNYGDNLTMNSYGKVRINFDSNNNDSADFSIGHHTTGTANTLLTLNDSGNLTITGELEATALDINGNADISGALTLGTALAVAEGGTGATNLNALVQTTGSQTIGGAKTFTSDITISDTYPKLLLTDTDSNDDWSIINNNGDFYIYNETDSKEFFRADEDSEAMQLGDGIDMTYDNIGTGNSGTVVRGGFLNPAAEANMVHLPHLINDLAGFNKWSNGTITVSGLYGSRSGSSGSYSYGSAITASNSGWANAFDSHSSTAGSWYSDNGTDGVYQHGTDTPGVITLEWPNEITYSLWVGIVFGSVSFSPTYVKIEAYRGGAWQTECEITDNNKNVVLRQVANNVGTGSATTKLRYTLGGSGNGSYFRIHSLYMANYAAGNNNLNNTGTDTTRGVNFLERYKNGYLHGHLYPGTDSTYNLGDGGTRWANVYADTLHGASLDINGNADISGTTALGGKVTITSTSDSKLNLRTTSGDSSEWNYIDFTGTNGTRDAYIGTNSNGSPLWNRDDGNVSLQLNSNYINASHRLNVQGELEATSLDINGNADISGVLSMAPSSAIPINITGTNSSYTAIAVKNTGTGDAGIYFDAINGDLSGSDYGFVGQNNSGYMEYHIGGSSPQAYHDFDAQVKVAGELEATSLDINGDGDVSGTLTVATISATNYGLASADIPNNAANTTGTAASSAKLTDGGTLTTQPGTNNLIYTGQISAGTSGLFATSDNSNSIITLNRHSGNYDSQLGFSSNGNLYYRKFSNAAINTTQVWKVLAFTDNANMLNSNVTLSSLGAAASSHNHDDRYYTETEIDAFGFLTSSSTQSKYLRSDEHDTTGFTITSSNGLGFKVDSAGSGRIEIESTNNWSYLRLQDNNTTSWDIASYDGGQLEWRPAGSATNRMTYTSGGVLTTGDGFTSTRGNTAYSHSQAAHAPSGATVNSSDATLLARANHTGTQTASTISDFDTEVANNSAVTANTAKVSNIVQTSVSGSSGSCTGNAATATLAATSTIASDTGSATHFPVFVDGSTGARALKSHSSWNYNPGTSTLTAGKLTTDTAAIVENAKSNAALMTLTGAGAGNEANITLKLAGTVHGSPVKMKMVAETTGGDPTGNGLLSYNPDTDTFGIGQTTTHNSMAILIDNNDVVSMKNQTTFTNGIDVTSAVNSTSKTTGTVKVAGGVGIVKTLNVGEDVVAYASSDERYKDNLKPITNPIDKVKSLTGYTFTWNDKHDQFNGNDDIGVVAQEVEKVFPEIVDTRDNGYKAVKYEKMVAVLIEAIKDQQKQIDKLKQMCNGCSK